MHTNERLLFLFRKYLENTCTKEELKELLELSQEKGLEQQLTEESKHYWESLDTRKLQDEVNWADNFKSIIDIAQSKESFQPQKSNVFKLQLLKIAVVLILIIGSAVIAWKSNLPQEKQYSASTKAPEKVNNSNTHRQLINLPDGSTVVLNANSKLEYPPDFSNTKREVYLSGEAFFDIAHDPSKPFIVHTGSVSTRVLGTAFNINAYRSQQFVEVTVTRGKVEVKAKEKILGVLQKNEQIVYHTGSENYSKKIVSTEPVVAWRKNELYFDDISFAEAALVLSNRYQVKIEFSNEKIRNCQFTAAFPNNTTLEHALTVICRLNNATYSNKENKIFIDGDGCD